MDARAGVSSTTISNKVQLSPETFERERTGGGSGIAECRRYGKGGNRAGRRVPRAVERKRNRER